MVDVSRTDARVTRQDRVTSNRALVLPSRNTDAPAFRPAGDMRSAARGAAGAEQLLQIVQGMKSAAADVQAAQLERFQFNTTQQARADRMQAGNDTMAGTVDDKKMKDSAAYRKWRTKGILDVKLAETKTAVQDDITQMMNSDQDGVWTPEDVDGIIGKHFKALITNPDGTPNEYLNNPEARELINAHYGEMRSQLITQAHDVMVTEQRDKDLNTAVEAFVRPVARGGSYDLESFMHSLPPQISKADGLHAAITGILGHATATENEEGLDRLLAATKADGKTPILGYQDMARLRETRSKVEEQRERRLNKEQNERHEKGVETLYKAFIDGGRPTREQVWEMAKNDQISARDARTLVMAIHSAEAEDRAESRAAASEARAARQEAREAYRDKVGIDLAWREVDWKLGNGPRNAAEASAAIHQLANQGKLGDGMQMAHSISSLDAAWKAGRTAINANPRFRTYGKMVGEWAKNGGGTATGAVAAALRGKTEQRVVWDAQDHYRELVMEKRMSPEAAYREVTKQKQPQAPAKPTAASLDAQLKAMEARRGQR